MLTSDMFEMPAPPATDADTALVARVCAGDGAAFELIMRRHNRLLFRTARGVVHDDADAQDIVQETYLRAYARLRSFRGEAALATWLVRIAINAALDTLRRRGRVVALDLSDGDVVGLDMEDPMSLRVSNRDLPETLAERSQVRALLAAAIDRLPALYRTVFILRAVEDMRVDDVARCLDVSESVVKTRFLRARSMLRQSLAVEFEAEAQALFEFAGARCEAVVRHVMGELARRHPGMLR